MADHDSDSDGRKERKVFSYSLTFRIAIDVAVMLAVVLGNIYFSLTEGYQVNPYPFLIVALGAYDIYRLWRMPLRKVRFFDKHVEVSGRNVNLNASYDKLEDVSRVKRIIGDFRSGSAVWFSFKDDPNDFMIPNRKVGRPKVELYEWLLSKNPSAKG